jgi:hypothetical protein
LGSLTKETKKRILAPYHEYEAEALITEGEGYKGTATGNWQLIKTQGIVGLI